MRRSSVSSTATRRTAPTCAVALALRMGPRPHRLSGSSYPGTACAVTDLVQLAPPLKSKLFHIYRRGCWYGVHVSIFGNTCLSQAQPNDNSPLLPDFSDHNYLFKARRTDAMTLHRGTCHPARPKRAFLDSTNASARHCHGSEFPSSY